MWYKSFKALAVSAFMFITHGCTANHRAEFPEPVKPILVMHGDVAFTKAEQSKVEKAAKTWESQTGGQAVVHIVWDYDHTQPAGDWHTIIKRDESDPIIVEADCAFSEEMGFPEGFCVPAVLAWVGPEDAGGIGIHNMEKEPATLNLIPARYESDDRWQSVIIHEFGHVFGVAHNTKDRYAVMWPSNDTRKTCLRQPDLHAFCDVNECDGRKMFPCE